MWSVLKILSFIVSIIVAASADCTTTEPVKNVVVKSSTAKILHVSWKNPDVTTGCIKNYRVCWDADLKKCKETTSDSETSLDISGLADCTDYPISVISVTNSATGTDSSPVQTTGHTGPGFVTHITVEDDNTTSASITWDLLNVATCAIDHYEVCWTESAESVNKNCKSTDDGTVTLYEITGLEECISYSVAVSAQESTEVDYSAAIQLSRAPGKVVNLTVSNPDVRSLHVEWEPPVEFTECVTNYQICWYPEYNSSDVNCDNTSSSDEYMYHINDLEVCNDYTVSVTAIGNSSKDPNNVISSFSSHSGPDLISDLSFEHVSSTSVLVKWDKPSDAENCDLEYQLCWSLSTDESGKQCRKVTNEVNIQSMVADLTECDEYLFEVQALEKSEKSATSYGKVPLTAYRGPNIVEDLTALSSAVGKLHVTWSPPNATVSCMLNNYTYNVCFREVSATSSNCESSTSETFIDLEKLSLCTEYEIKVAAHVKSGYQGIYTEIIGITAPSFPEVVTVDHTSIATKWTSSKQCSGKYTVCIYKTEDDENSQCKDVGTSTTYKFEGLEECTEYTEVLQFTDADGHNTFNSYLNTKTTCSGHLVTSFWGIIILCLIITNKLKTC